MKVIKSSASLMKHDVTPYEFIEKVGRTCYKSEDKITEGSAEKFVGGLIKRKHLAMLEHETIYLEMTRKAMRGFIEDLKFAGINPKFFNITNEKNIHVLSGSFRSFYELFSTNIQGFNIVDYIRRGLKTLYPLVFGEFKDSTFVMDYSSIQVQWYDRGTFIEKFKNIPEVLFKHLTHTFLFVCDRGVSHEFVRHRPCSFAQESTRYCNYSKDKFGEEITVIEPPFWGGSVSSYAVWKASCLNAEQAYFTLLKNGATPQEARAVLPNSLKTELIITATEEEWQHIVNLRYKGTTGAPHPQMFEVMKLAIDDIFRETDGRVNIKNKSSEPVSIGG